MPKDKPSKTSAAPLKAATTRVAANKEVSRTSGQKVVMIDLSSLVKPVPKQPQTSVGHREKAVVEIDSVSEGSDDQGDFAWLEFYLLTCPKDPPPKNPFNYRMDEQTFRQVLSMACNGVDGHQLAQDLAEEPSEGEDNDEGNDEEDTGKEDEEDV
ncbi:hypothetical protein FRC10_012096 [Ceratobasidium sp. 414]|nr:hypothetical protein FRC10_012096 [Ceratobasidium sp. 414]